MDHENYPDPDIPVDEAWAQLNALLDNVPDKPTPRHPAASVIRKMIWYGGAALVVVSTIIYVALRHDPGKQPAVVGLPAATGRPDVGNDTSQEMLHVSSHVYTSQHIPRKDILPDRTVFFLDQNSYVRVQQDAGSNIAITVNGGAYFESVRPDGKGQGRVSIQAGEMKVLPHQASVYAAFDSASGVSSVQLQSGSAEIKVGNASVILLAGESVQFDEKTKRLSAKQKADVNACSYATHVFEFNNMPFKDAVAYVEKAYGVKIRVADAELSNSRITTRFNNKTLKEVLEIMAYTLNFEYSLDEIKKVVLIKAVNGGK